MKKIIFILTLLASVFIINNFVRSIYNLWKKQDLVVNIQRELEAQKKENKDLTRKLTIAQDPNFIEQEARNKLMLVKPGENKVFIDKDLLKDVSGASIQDQKDSRSNLQKWWSLFF